MSKRKKENTEETTGETTGCESDVLDDSSGVEESTSRSFKTNAQEKFTRVLSKETLRTRLSDLKKKSPAVALVAGPPNHFGDSFWFLKKDVVTIGRTHDADIAVHDASMSKVHGQFSVVDDVVHYTDLGSTNGTQINGSNVKPNMHTQLRDSDLIQVGNVRVKFLEAGHMHQDIYKKLLTDPLTGIHNRGALDATGGQMIKVAHSKKNKIGVILFDLDDFKSINDTYGHKAGDFVLKSVVRLTKKYLQVDDLFARLGGDEFCIVLGYTEEDNVYKLAKNIQLAITGKEFVFGGKQIKVSGSFGVSFFKPGYDSWESLLDRADKAHYDSKKSGKDQVS